MSSPTSLEKETLKDFGDLCTEETLKLRNLNVYNIWNAYKCIYLVNLNKGVLVIENTLD